MSSDTASTPVRRTQGITQLRNQPLFDAGRTPPSGPWQGLEGGVLTLAGGWYTLAASAPCLVELRAPERHLLVELAAGPDRPASVRLEAGRYRSRLFTAARPGVAASDVFLTPMTAAARAALLAGRAAQALRHGISPARFAALAARALRPSGTFGVRAAGQGEASGVLGGADREQAWRPPANLDARLAALREGPVFLTGDAMSGQVYGGRTADPARPYGWRLVTAAEERLTPDALLLFAEAIVAHPAADIVLADRWEGGIATHRVAFDPLLYAGGLPTPRVERRGAVVEGPWSGQQPRFAALGVPVAEVAAADAGRPPVLLAPDGEPATIVIPTRDKAAVLRTCLDSLAGTSWPHEIVIVDNGSVEAETFALFATLEERGVRIVRDDAPFNFSRLSNRGAAEARGRWLVFMNNDIEVLDGGWLEHMLACAALPDAGAVGARLLYDDGSLQHGGVALGLTELCGHPWRHLPAGDIAGVDRLARTSLRSAVTGALLCVDRAKFEAVGGFDETAFPVTLNDVDLCLKLRARGWFNIYCAEAAARHPEGVSRGADDDPARRARRQAELDAFAARWPCGPDDDPWLPPAAMRSSEGFALK